MNLLQIIANFLQTVFSLALWLAFTQFVWVIMFLIIVVFLIVDKLMSK